MVPKREQKRTAIRLRKAGNTYSEILKVVPVAKSTLSLWLRDVGLAKRQQQRITNKRIEARLRGAQARKDERLERDSKIVHSARGSIGGMSDRELLLIGTALYWAEGTKFKEFSRERPGLDFCNTDARMIVVYLAWLKRCLMVPDEDLRFSIYIHENSKHRIAEVKQYWMRMIGARHDVIQYVYFKKHNIKTVRKNISNKNYFGLLRVRVQRSTELNRKVEGWTLGIAGNYGRLV